MQADFARPVLILDVPCITGGDPMLAALAQGVGAKTAVQRLAEYVASAFVILGQRTVLVVEREAMSEGQLGGEKVSSFEDAFAAAFAIPNPNHSREETLITVAMAFLGSGIPALVVTEDDAVAAELMPLGVPTMNPGDYIHRLRSALGRLEARQILASKELGQGNELIAALEAASLQAPLESEDCETNEEND